MSRVLVTGGAGFIGSHLTARLVALGHEVRVLDSLATGRLCNLDDVRNDVELIDGDIRDLGTVQAAVAGCEVIYHQAALPSVPRSIADPVTSTETNVLGTLNVLIAAREQGVRRVVNASSSSVYGANHTLPKHERLEPMPISPYAAAKLAGEGYCRSFAVVHGLETVSLRYFNVFGPHQDPASQYSAVIPSFVDALLRGCAPTIHGDGEQSRDFTYVDDVVHANLLAAEAPISGGEKYNVACGSQVSLNTLYGELCALMDVQLPAHHGPPRAGDVRHTRASLERIGADLGYRAEVSLREGLARTVEHLAARPVSELR